MADGQVPLMGSTWSLGKNRRPGQGGPGTTSVTGAGRIRSIRPSPRRGLAPDER
jgi:hypothetical protein